MSGFSLNKSPGDGRSSHSRTLKNDYMNLKSFSLIYYPHTFDLKVSEGRNAFLSRSLIKNYVKWIFESTYNTFEMYSESWTLWSHT